MDYIYTGKIVGIRPYRNSDIVAFYEAATESIDHVYEFLPWCHPGYTVEESAVWVRSRSQAWCNADEYSFVIYLLRDESLAGGVGINQINESHKFGNIGYWVRRSMLNQGIANESVTLVKKFGFEVLKLNRLEIVSDPLNKASRRVAEKAGAKFEGILQKRLLNNGISVDAAMYSLVSTP